jgi:hypothetical protein
MPTDQDPKKQDPKPQDGSQPPSAGSPTLPPLFPPGGLSFNTLLFNGDLTGSVTNPGPNQYLGTASYLFKNGDTLGANLLLGTQPLLIEQYGLNGTFGIGDGGTAKFGFDAMPPKDTYKWMTDIKFGDGSLLNGELSKSPQGDIFKAGGLWKFDKEQQLSGSVELNGVEKFNQFKLGGNFNDKHAFNLDYKDSPTGSIFKGDGKTTLKPGETLNGAFEFNDVEKFNQFKLGGNFNDKHAFNLDYKDSSTGSIFKGDGKTTLKPGEILTGAVELNGVEKFNQFKLGGNFNDKHAFNLDYKDSPTGSIFKGDGKTTLKPGEVLTGAFEFNGVEKFKQFQVGGNFNDKHTFNFDFKDSPAGSIFKGDGKTTIGPGSVLTGGLELNGVEKFKDFKLGGNFDDKHGFNLNYKDSPLGSIFKADGKTTFGTGDILSGSVQINGVEKFKEYTLGYTNLGGSKLDLGLKTLETGSIFNADGKLMLNKKDYLTGSVLLNGPEKTNDFKLGANINNNLYNFNLGTSPLGTNVGVDAKFGFDDGKGQVGLEGKFGPKLSEATGSLTFKSKDLEYGGNIKFNNETGGFGLAELGAKLKKGDDRFNYGLEASVNPRSGDFKVGFSLNWSFGGGGSSRSSASEARAVPDRYADPVADFRQKQSQVFDKQAIDRLNPNDRALFDQAKTGVEKLNAQGASFNVERTAMSLAALANEKGFAKIENVELGKPSVDGRQNLFIFDREPTHPLAKSAMADPATASNTPVRASADVLQRTPDVVDAGKAVAPLEVAPGKRQ